MCVIAQVLVCPQVRRQERRYAQLERLQAQSADTCRRLQADILGIKQQKVRRLSHLHNIWHQPRTWNNKRWANRFNATHLALLHHLNTLFGMG